MWFGLEEIVELGGALQPQRQSQAPSAENSPLRQLSELLLLGFPTLTLAPAHRKPIDLVKPEQWVIGYSP